MSPETKSNLKVLSKEWLFQGDRLRIAKKMKVHPNTVDNAKKGECSNLELIEVVMDTVLSNQQRLLNKIEQAKRQSDFLKSYTLMKAS
jgi:hypothetical protein